MVFLYIYQFLLPHLLAFSLPIALACPYWPVLAGKQHVQLTALGLDVSI